VSGCTCVRHNGRLHKAQRALAAWFGQDQPLCLLQCGPSPVQPANATEACLSKCGDGTEILPPKPLLWSCGLCLSSICGGMGAHESGVRGCVCVLKCRHVCACVGGTMATKRQPCPTAQSSSTTTLGTTHTLPQWGGRCPPQSTRCACIISVQVTPFAGVALAHVSKVQGNTLAGDCVNQLSS